MMSLADAATMLGTSLSTLRRIIADGAIPVVHVRSRRLIDPKDLDAYISTLKQTRVPICLPKNVVNLGTLALKSTGKVLKISRPCGCAGSIPAPGTNKSNT